MSSTDWTAMNGKNLSWFFQKKSPAGNLGSTTGGCFSKKHLQGSLVLFMLLAVCIKPLRKPLQLLILSQNY